MYDVIIVGAGPAGLTAAIYAKRAMLNVLVIEKSYMGGGQVLNTYEVDNYPGLKGISGFDLGNKFQEHAKELGVDIIEADVVDIVDKGKIKEIITEEKTYEARSVIISTGASHRKLNVPGEEELTGMGVSYCATCDGAFFKDKTTVVVGGGDVAVEDAIFLSRMCKKVYLVHRRDELRAAKMLQDTLLGKDNIEVVWDSVVEKINGEAQVESISIKNVKTNEQKVIMTDGVFVAIGMTPNNDIVEKLVEVDKNGWIIAGEDCKTSKEGFWAIGDVRTKALRQIITAAADGANAITSIQNYL